MRLILDSILIPQLDQYVQSVHVFPQVRMKSLT